jgi:hypothetical protein
MAAVRFDVPRVSPSIDPHEFLQKYYVPRCPVVIEAAAQHWPALHHWTHEYLTEKLDSSASCATRKLLWWDIDRTLIADDVIEPKLIDALRARLTPRERTRSRRLWMSQGGERTPWHYDGNSLEIFNAQVVGRKRFTLVSPHTPLDLGAFSLLGHKPEASPDTLLTDTHHYTTFDMNAGDLLYLPRHWFHFVESLDAFNANVNWVWTDLASGSLENPVSRREQELVAGMYPLFALSHRLSRTFGWPRLRVKHFSHEYTAEYGGASDFEVPRSFLRERGVLRIVRTLLSESLAGLGHKLTRQG